MCNLCSILNQTELHLHWNQHIKSSLQDEKSFNWFDKRALSWSVKRLSEIPEGGKLHSLCLWIEKLASLTKQFEAQAIAWGSALSVKQPKKKKYNNKNPHPPETHTHTPPKHWEVSRSYIHKSMFIVTGPESALFIVFLKIRISAIF